MINLVAVYDDSELADEVKNKRFAFAVVDGVVHFSATW